MAPGDDLKEPEGAAKVPGAVMNRPDNAPMEATTGTEMTAAQQQVSKELKAAYPEYINGLRLVDKDGKALSLDENGQGSFAEYIKSIYMESAQKALDQGKDLSSKSWLTIKDGKVVDMDLAGYARDVTRLKAAPAFDALDLSSGENQEFGTASIDKQHFTDYGERHSLTTATTADKAIVKLLNPLNYIASPMFRRLDIGVFATVKPIGIQPLPYRLSLPFDCSKPGTMLILHPLGDRATAVIMT